MASPTTLSGLKGGALLLNRLLAQNRNRFFCQAVNSSRHKAGLQKLAHDQFTSSHFNLDLIPYLKARLEDMFESASYWDSIYFENSLAALKPLSSGNVMKVIKTLLNGWTTTSRIEGDHDIYLCLFCCHGVHTKFHHHLMRPMLFSLC